MGDVPKTGGDELRELIKINHLLGYHFAKCIFLIFSLLLRCDKRNERRKMGKKSINSLFAVPLPSRLEIHLIFSCRRNPTRDRKLSPAAVDSSLDEGERRKRRRGEIRDFKDAPSGSISRSAIGENSL